MNTELDPGKYYFFRTVTMIYTGMLDYSRTDAFVITKASWIADTGKFGQAIVDCNFLDVVHYPIDKKVFIFKSSLVEVFSIEKLPDRK